MEALLEKLESERKSAPVRATEDISRALQNLARALEKALPLLLDDGEEYPENEETKEQGGSVSASWLLGLCGKVPSALEASHLARAVVDASRLSDEAQQQAALFDALGESEEAMMVLMEVAPRLSEIKEQVSVNDLTSGASQPSEVMVDLEHERRELLRHEAIDTAQLAAIAKAELEALLSTSSFSGGATHTVVSRQSEKQARKFAEKTAKHAAQALKRAKEAGAILEENEDLLSMINNSAALGQGGLMNRSQDEVWALQQALLPEGSREYYDKRGLPHGAEHIKEDGLEKVIIPAARRDQANLPARLKIRDIMDAEFGKAFAGTTSLNPMQSVTFETAFHQRENMLVCAPTGAGT